MQDDEIDVEGNMRASGKIKMVDDTEYKYKGKVKEEVGISQEIKNYQEEKINEMTWIIKNLSNKITRMEMKGSIPSILLLARNPSQLQQSNNMQMMYKENRNEEKHLWPPVCENNNNLLENPE